MATLSLAFDGTTYTIAPSRIHGGTRQGYDVTVMEGAHTLTLETYDGADLYRHALVNVAAVRAMDAWTRDRIVYVFSLAARAIAQLPVPMVPPAWDCCPA